MASKIKKFYEGRVVFLTGGSGFFGKVLLLKLLQSCPNIKGIIALLRKKHGQSCKERLFNILSSSVSVTGFALFHRSIRIFTIVSGAVWEAQPGKLRLNTETQETRSK
jgi:ABC-type transporter Mla maintaining outer membrane lipid asymmetry ATPase subunit MlaF